MSRHYLSQSLNLIYYIVWSKGAVSSCFKQLPLNVSLILLLFIHISFWQTLINTLVLIHCNIANNSYQQNSRVLYIFVPNKSFGQLLDISPENFIYLKTFESECFYIEVWFADQNSNPLEIEDKISL